MSEMAIFIVSYPVGGLANSFLFIDLLQFRP
jgi:hypothetical protein